MPLSALMSILGLSQNNHHFLSERKREVDQLRIEYEALLRETLQLDSSSQLMLDTYLKDLHLPTNFVTPEEIKKPLNERIVMAKEALDQIEQNREIMINTKAKRFSLEKWNEILSRMQIMKGAAEMALTNAREMKIKVESLCNTIIEIKLEGDRD